MKFLGLKGENSYFLGISSSFDKNIQSVADFIDRDKSPFTTSHLVNIRPLGFGTPKSDRLSAQDIATKFPQFNTVWTVANHRQEQHGITFKSLNASSKAAKFSRAGVDALLDCLSITSSREILWRHNERPKIGIIGMSSYDRKIDVNGHIRRAIYSMLCEELPLESAGKIYIVVPNNQMIIQHNEHMIAGTKFNIEIIPRPKTNWRTPLVSFALGIEPITKNRQQFSNFCFLLFSQFGEVRWIEENVFNLILETFSVTVAAADNKDEILDYSNRKWTAADNVVVVTNKTVSLESARRSLAQSPNLIHYSKFPDWLYHRRQYDLWEQKL